MANFLICTHFWHRLLEIFGLIFVSLIKLGILLHSCLLSRIIVYKYHDVFLYIIYGVSRQSVPHKVAPPMEIKSGATLCGTFWRDTPYSFIRWYSFMYIMSFSYVFVYYKIFIYHNWKIFMIFFYYGYLFIRYLRVGELYPYDEFFC